MASIPQKHNISAELKDFENDLIYKATVTETTINNQDSYNYRSH